MAIAKTKKTTKETEERKNKFDNAVNELDEQEELDREKAGRVVKALAGSNGKTKTITDKNGRVREIKVAEKRKTLPVYIPEKLYEQFDAITTAYGQSNNAAIVKMITEYVMKEKSVLEEL